MNAKEDIEIRKKLAISIQAALNKHRVDPENISETVDFLAQVIGGVIGALLPRDRHAGMIDGIKQEIEYGIKMGIPE